MSADGGDYCEMNGAGSYLELLTELDNTAGNDTVTPSSPANYKNTNRNVESKVEYTASPPSYTPPASNPYQTAGAAPSLYPAPAAAPGPTSYPSPGPQQYPPPAQYLPPPQKYPPATGYGYGQPQPRYGTRQYGATPPPRQQQQRQVVVVGVVEQLQPIIVQEVPSYVGEIVFACIVFWLCNCIFGLIAFILAAVASSNAVLDARGARKLGHASIAVSTAGIVVTVFVGIILYLLLARATTGSATYATGAASSSSSCRYTYRGTCYGYKDYVGYYGGCSGQKTSSGYCYYG